MIPKRYETAILFDPELPEDARKEFLGKLSGIVAAYKGEVLKTDDWGNRKLAYPIDRYGDGIYVLNHLRLDPETAADFERFLRINDDVMRHILVRMDV